VCYVNPGQVSERELNIGPVKVLPAQTILPHHFWLGVTLAGKKGKHSSRRGQVL